MAICAVLLVVASLATQAGSRSSDRYVFFVLGSAFNLDGENNIPAWFSTISLFLCALILVAIGAVCWKQNGGHRWYWIGLSVVFLGLSLDEAASIHEWLVLPLRRRLDLGGYFYYAWVIPGGLFTLAVGLAFLRFVIGLPRVTRTRFFVAGIIYCSGALGMELIGGKYASAHGMRNWTYILIASLEESLEMLGTILFLQALLVYWREYVGEVRLSCAWPDGRPLEGNLNAESQQREVEVVQRAGHP
jgi:hypothetical protein